MNEEKLKKANELKQSIDYLTELIKEVNNEFKPPYKKTPINVFIECSKTNWRLPKKISLKALQFIMDEIKKERLAQLEEFNNL